MADRIAVMYAGDVIEVGETHEIFFHSKHPYTWALISSLPSLAQKGTIVFHQGHTSESFQEIKGDAFAPRNPYALKIDFIERPPFSGQ